MTAALAHTQGEPIKSDAVATTISPPPNAFYLAGAQPESAMTASKLESFHEFHHSMGHLLVPNPEAIYRDGQTVPSMPSGFDCSICHASKSTHRRPKRRSTCRSVKPFEVIHSDLSGQFSHKSLSGAQYYISFIDEATGFAWVRFLKLKSDAAQTIIDFIEQINTQFGIHPKHVDISSIIKVFKSDNGGEYIVTKLQDYFQRKGINHITVPPYHHEMNGRPERFNQTISTMARAMLDSEKLLFLWAEAVATATYLKNIAPHSADKLHCTPFELLHKKKPSIKRLHPFGIVAYVHIPKEARKPGTKLLHRAEQGVFVGYGHSTKICRVYIPERHVV
jgi:hypothetical protein